VNRTTLRATITPFLFCWVVCSVPPGQPTPAFYTHEQDAGPGRSLARLTSRVLFNAGLSQEETPFFAYGYLSHVEGFPAPLRKNEDESSAALTFLVEGRVVDVDRRDTTFVIKSEGALRVFFAQQVERSFSQPDGFRSGQEVAVYNLKRYVFFSSAGD
jgi:hypothetical protein